MKTLKIYAVNCKETGNNVSYFLTEKEANNYLIKSEEEDKADGYYTEGFYEIEEKIFEGLDEMFIITVSADSYQKARVERLTSFLIKREMHNYTGVITDRGGSMDFNKAMNLLRKDTDRDEIEEDETSFRDGNGCYFEIQSIESLLNQGVTSLIDTL